MARRRIQDDFWSKVDTSGGPDACWPWTAAKGKSGYGHVKWNGELKYAHRIAYMLTHGDLGNLCVLHRCDNRLCCNPAHHFKGTYNDNNQDKKNKGRVTRLLGETNPAAVLDWDKVRQIRELYASGEYRKCDIARMFGVTQANIYLIISGRHWKEAA